MASATGHAGVDELARRRKCCEAEEVVGGGKQRRNGVELGQRGNVFVADEVHVVERGGMKLHQRRKLLRRELANMRPHSEVVRDGTCAGCAATAPW